MNDAWLMFRDLFRAVINKHAPFKILRIKNRYSPWLNRDLAVLLHHKNAAWRKARLSGSTTDSLLFRQIRNKATQAVRRAKAGYFIEQFTLSGSTPSTFWKTVRKLENKPSTRPLSLKVDDLIVTDKNSMADIFNQHFIKSGFVFESLNPSSISKTPEPLSPTPQPSVTTSPGCAPDLSVPPHSFSLLGGRGFAGINHTGPQKTS